MQGCFECGTKVYKFGSIVFCEYCEEDWKP